MNFPQPEMYRSWEEWARALMLMLEQREHRDRLEIPAVRGWVDASYEGGWAAAVNSAQYVLHNGMVYMRGDALLAAVAAPSTIFTLRPKYRPRFETHILASTGNGVTRVRIVVYPTGEVEYGTGSETLFGAGVVDLSSIFFPAEAKTA